MCPTYLNDIPARFRIKNASAFVFFSEYGGYRADVRYSERELMLLTKHGFLCVNVSNECFPWYAPMPLMPTPPNGNDSTAEKSRFARKMNGSFRAVIDQPSIKLKSFNPLTNIMHQRIVYAHSARSCIFNEKLLDLLIRREYVQNQRQFTEIEVRDQLNVIHITESTINYMQNLTHPSLTN